MKQSLLTVVTILVTILSLSVVIYGSKSKSTVSVPLEQKKEQPTKNELVQKEDSPIFFYGNTCPHCKDVEYWMKKNSVEEKINVIKKEVYENRSNAEELVKAAKSCGLDTNSIGVPFLYAEGKCIVGSPDVINYLSSKIVINSVERSDQ